MFGESVYIFLLFIYLFIFEIMHFLWTWEGKIKKNPQNPVNIVDEWLLTAIVQHLQGFLDELKFLQ